VADRIDIALLRDRLRRDLLAAVAPDDVAEDVLHALGLVERLHDSVDRRRPDFLPCLDELDELVHDGAPLSDAGVVAGDRQSVAAQEDLDLQTVAQRVEDAVADRRELCRDVVRNVEHLFRQASFSFTSWDTTDPSALPETCGMTSAMTRPKSRMLVAPFSAIASSTISSSSSSASGSGMNSSSTASSPSSARAWSSRPPVRKASAASTRRLRSRCSTCSSSSSESGRCSSFSAERRLERMRRRAS